MLNNACYKLSISLKIQFRTKKAIKNEKSFANIHKIIHVRLIFIPTYVSSPMLVGKKKQVHLHKNTSPCRISLIFLTLHIQVKGYSSPPLTLFIFFASYFCHNKLIQWSHIQLYANPKGLCEADRELLPFLALIPEVTQ